MEDIPLGTLVATIGFVIGLAFGATVQRTNFCSMGATCTTCTSMVT